MPPFRHYDAAALADIFAMFLRLFISLPPAASRFIIYAISPRHVFAITPPYYYYFADDFHDDFRRCR